MSTNPLVYISAFTFNIADAVLTCMFVFVYHTPYK